MKSSAPPFPVFLLAYLYQGSQEYPTRFQDAQANGYVATLKHNAAAKLGILHASWGVGALISPLVSTKFSQQPRWSFHFLVSLVLAILNSVVLLLVFKFRHQDECLELAGEVLQEKEAGAGNGTFRRVMSDRSVHFLAIFIFIYIGVEVTIGGTTIRFPFFGVLESTEITIWFVPSLIENAIAVFVVGVLLGPMYPIVMNQASRILPRGILTGSIGWIAGSGQAGSAALPFMTGAIASRHGIQSLQPLVVAMMAFMMLLWALVPASPRRTD
ncbi:hypothetical protein B0H34DRAFT_808609 [Crassisporium funariophilum]|nr:hypothetical protein B0H34DRAFT_808609 [Crassisporium funariophilum]